MYLKMLDDCRPTHVGVVFDAPGPTFRHEQYEEYKAGRAGLASELGPQIDLIKEVLKAMRVPVYEIPGYEADDTIGTLACRAAAEGCEAMILTGDRDVLQLADQGVKCILTVKGVSETAIFGPNEVRQTYGVEPDAMRDVKALMGDVSDNVPGIRGIGEKTALKLVQRYGRLEEIYAGLDSVKGKVRELLEQGREQAFQGRDLVTIRCDVPVELDLDKLRLGDPDGPALGRLLRDLELRSLVRRFFPGGAPEDEAVELSDRTAPSPVSAPASPLAPAQPPSPAVAVESPAVLSGSVARIRGPEIELLATVAGLREAVEWLLTCSRVGIEFLHQDSRPTAAALWGVGLAGAGPAQAGSRGPSLRAYYAPVRPPAGGLFPADGEAAALPESDVLAELAPLLSSHVPKVIHDAKTALVILGRRRASGCGVDEAGLSRLPGLEMDTAVVAYLIEPARLRYDLERLAPEYLRCEIPAAPSEPRQESAGRRALALLELVPPLQAELAARRLEPLWEQVERPLICVLAGMELTGVRLDLPVLERMGLEFSARLTEVTAQVQELAGVEFNLNSTQQLGDVLYNRLGLPVTKRTSKGKVASTDAETLDSLADKHPIVPLILEHRQIQKLNSTYVDGLRALVDPQDGRIRTVFNQTVTTTGRLSSTEPNLQNIPVREEIGRQLRRAFVASSPDHILLSADYSQIELRVLAHLSQDPVLIEAFELDQDIHRRTASEVFGVGLDEVTPAMRQAAKAVNFGIIYGISDFGLARSLGVSKAEAGAYIARYFERYRRVDEFVQEQIAQARRDGYVTTILGRRRYLPDLFDNNRNIRAFGERTARNTPIQGSAADIIKVAMVNLDQAIRSRRWATRMVLQVHDELLFDASRGELDDVTAVVRREMEGAYRLKVPLKVDIRTGDDWYRVKDA
jgi:DNA polymerase-1